MEAIQECQSPNVPIHFQLLEIWTRALGRAPEGIDESFFDLGGHSLLLAGMMEEVERATGKYVSIVRFLEEPTIRHLADCLAEEAREDDVTLIQPGRAGVAPLFYFHGDVLGGGFYARQLAALLGEEQPVYSIAPVRLDGDKLPTIEEIARRRVDAIRQHCPRGPYILGGFCIGGLTAQEAARQLTERGEEVLGVLLINPQLAGSVLRSHLRLVQKRAQRNGQDVRTAVDEFMRGHRKLERLRGVWNAPLRDKADFVLRNSKKIVNGASGNEEHATEAPPAPPAPTRNEWVLSAFEWIATAHVPKRCDRPVTLFLTEDMERFAPFLVRKWRKAARNLDVQRIPGEHLTCITTFVSFLAAKLRVELVKLQSGLSMFFSVPLLAEL